MSKSKFGGDKYKPHNLGPEPASPQLSPAEPPAVAASQAPSQEAPVTAAPPSAVTTPPRKAGDAPLQKPAKPLVPDIKVPYSSRISYAADLQLKALCKEDHTQVDLLAEAMNLLFKKYGLDELA